MFISFLQQNIFIQLIIVCIFSLVGWFSTGGKKVQFVRLLDVFVYGPVLIYVSLYEINNIWLHYLVLFFGITTISYNAKNFIKKYRLN
jgi:hypothetical protein